MRWRQEGEDGQSALFDADERHVGRGEFRGLTFHHVRAKRLVNSLPASTRLPFRHTLNAYRGCAHACSYCLDGSTPILLADGRQRALADLRVGDRVIGTERRGTYRHLVETEVFDHWATRKEAYRVTLADGTTLVASGDHRFLTERGWKHVVGAGRPHLTTNNRLLGVGALPPAPGHDDDYRRGYLAGMIRGDGTLGTYRYPRGNGSTSVSVFRLALVDDEPLRRSERFLAELGVPTTAGCYAEATATRRAVHAIRASGRVRIDRIRTLIAVPGEPTPSWRRGFLAGIFDAEGSCSQVIRICNSSAPLFDLVAGSLDELGYAFTLERVHGDVANVRITGGLPAMARFWTETDPATTRKRSFRGRALKVATDLRVTAIEPVGERPLFDITTGTGDFIANGVVSHNCFARPTHDYLGFDVDQGFERDIVVKVNAVERLRAELEPKRWCGEPIAMGTNTDPYQRCEGKYHLTQGLIEVLAAARNPFSILTKSTLLLRDADLLAEAHERTDVSLLFSVGTLDDDVWRATEPGTPPPTKRLEAIARLRDRGIPCGVLVAPILPGLSDSPEQIKAVVAAAREAGAATIGGGMLLYLTELVRPVFLRRLAESHPHLLERYEALYQRTRPPKAEQQRVSAILEEALEGFRPTTVRVRPRRPKTAPMPAKEAAQQLALGV